MTVSTKPQLDTDKNYELAELDESRASVESEAEEKAGPEKLAAGEDFELEILEADPWKARVHWAPHGTRTAYSVLLYRRGMMIHVDHGSREAGGRRTTGESDPKLAIAYAEEALLVRVRRYMAEDPGWDDIDNAGGDLSLLQCKKLALDDPEFLEHSKTHREQIIRAWDNLITMKGAAWSVLDFRAESVREYHRIRTEEILEYPKWLDRPRPTLKPCGLGNAAKELGLVKTGMTYVAGLRQKSDNQYKVLRFNPFENKAVKKAMISPASQQGPPKRPLETRHFMAFMRPEPAEDGTMLPAPVDAVDESGQTRLIVAFHFYFGRRNGAIRNVRRGHILETPAQIRAVLKEINGPVRPEWASYFKYGIVRFPGDYDKNGYERIAIINKYNKAELDRYDEKVGWRSWDPKRPMFGREENPMQPVSEKTIYQTPQQKKAQRGETYLNATGHELVAEGGELCFQPDGEIITRGHKGGRYQLARQLVRDRALARGEDADDVMPIYSGEVAHGWRVGWAQRVHQLGYGRIVKVEGVEEIDLDVNADYLGSWVMKRGAKAERYVQLVPEVLVGIAEFRNSDKVLPQIRERLAREVSEELDALDELMELGT